MDQETSCKNLSHVDQGNNENLSNSVNGVVLEAIIVINSSETASVNGENGNLGSKDNELGSNKVIGEVPEREINQERHENSNNAVDGVNGVRHETVIVINSDEMVMVSGENRESVAKVTIEMGSSKAKVEKPKTKVAEAGKQSCVIDVKCGGGGGGGDGGVGGGFKENWDGERVCRICHLSSEGSLETTAAADTTAVTMDLIQLGCGCKDELGIAHVHCAEAWFKLKGNRMCEICGQSAKNITGVGDNRFMEEWNERRFTGGSSSSSVASGGCWRGQPFCNFLMACLVIAFVLPWFFRVNMF